MRHPGKTDSRTIALLGGLCFFLSAIEYMIPKPLPFIRIGLANLPLLLALDLLPFPSFILLACLKVTGQALISGTLFSYVFFLSLGGTGASVLVMYILRKAGGKKWISFTGIGAAGAMASNGVQLILAYFLIFRESVRYIAAPVLALGLITGTLLGMACEYFTGRSRWYAGHIRGEETPPGVSTAPGMSLPWGNSRSGNGETKNLPGQFRKKREVWWEKNINPNELAITGLCMAPALLLNPDTNMRIIQFLFFWALAWLSGKKNNPLITISIMLGIVFFSLLIPYGELLFSIGPLRVTSGALWGGIRRAVTLEGLFMLSRCCVRRNLGLPGAAGKLLGESFRVFSIIPEKKLPPGNNWVKRLDDLLIYLDTMEDDERGGEKKEPESGLYDNGKAASGRSTAGARIILIVMTILAWLPILLLCVRVLLLR